MPIVHHNYSTTHKILYAEFICLLKLFSKLCKNPFLFSIEELFHLMEYSLICDIPKTKALSLDKNCHFRVLFFFDIDTKPLE